MNKSLATNLLALLVCVLGWFLTGDARGPVFSMGLFALSGALTNWLAVHMLFEKVPGLYGSGVIPTRFEDFKRGIHELIMQQFFTRENMERLLSLGSEGLDQSIDSAALEEAVDYDLVFQKVVDGVMKSELGGMLSMFGGAQALERVKDPVIEQLRGVVGDVVASPRFQEKLHEALPSGGAVFDTLEDKVGTIVQGRLDELTPEEVKRIVQEMIRQHLGWLVVWGGVFGGLIGLLAGLLAG